MIVLNPRVHQTVTPTSDTQVHGCAVSHGTGSPAPSACSTRSRRVSPSRWLRTPRLGSSTNRNRTPTTATPSTYGRNTTARRNVRPGNLRLSAIASSSGSVSRNGTDATTKTPVAAMPSQNRWNTTLVGSNRSA